MKEYNRERYSALKWKTIQYNIAPYIGKIYGTLQNLTLEYDGHINLKCVQCIQYSTTRLNKLSTIQFLTIEYDRVEYIML